MTGQTQDVLKKIETCDSTLSEAAVAAAVKEAASEWEKTARQVSMVGVEGAPDWLLFEGKIWELGESLRQCLIKRKQWRSWVNLFDEIARLATDLRFRKGRQSLVLLLGEFAAVRYRDVLLALINDDDVKGHAVMALRRGKVADTAVAERVRDLALREKGWIRKEATKYLKFYEG